MKARCKKCGRFMRKVAKLSDDHEVYLFACDNPKCAEKVGFDEAESIVGWINE